MITTTQPAVAIPRKVRAEVTFEAHGAKFRVLRCSQSTYMLTCPLVTPHARFGNRKEIAQDIAHCVEFGTLPPFSSHGMY